MSRDTGVFRCAPGRAHFLAAATVVAAGLTNSRKRGTERNLRFAPRPSTQSASSNAASGSPRCVTVALPKISIGLRSPRRSRTCSWCDGACCIPRIGALRAYNEHQDTQRRNGIPTLEAAYGDCIMHPTNCPAVKRFFRPSLAPQAERQLAYAVDSYRNAFLGLKKKRTENSWPDHHSFVGTQE